MTVSTQVSRNEYTGNGATTQYDFTFRILDKSHLLVQTLDTSESIVTLTLGTDYTVTGVNRYNGGKVVLTSALPTGYKISIERKTPVTQETSIRNQGGFFPEIHEDAFDKLTMLVQQVYGWWSGLALKKPSWLANYYDAMNNRIRNLRDPSQAQDAATKGYADNLYQGAISHSDNNFKRTLRVPESEVGMLPGISGRRKKILAFNDTGNPIAVLPESGSAADVLIELGSSDGFKFIGKCPSFSDLRRINSANVGDRILLASHQGGWAAQASPPVGGGEFVAIAGSAVDDGGYICVPEGQSSFYWMRVLGSNEYLTPQMYGYITGYDASTETGMELKPYIQAAIDTSISIGKSKVLLPDGDYYSAIGNIELAGTGHNRSAGVLVFGENPAHTKMGTRIYFDAPELTSPLFVSRSPSSVHTGQHIDDLWLGTPVSKRYRGIALQLVGTCHMLSQRVHVERLYDGINFLNTRSLSTDNDEGDKNAYCELDTFRDWTINKCVNAISFNNDGTGDASLHGVAFKNLFIQLKEDGNGLYFKGAAGGLLWYGSPENDIKFWGGADATTTCQLIRLESTEVRGVSGQMTWEGYGRISCDQYSWWRFNGDIFGIPSSLAMIDYSGVVSESYLGDARVAFNNTTSKDHVAMSNPVMSGFYMRPIMPFSRAAKKTTNIPVAMPVRITSSPLEFPTDTSNYEGIAFPTFHNGGVWFGEVVNQSVWSAMIPSMKIESSNGAISNYYGSGMTLYNFTANGVSLSNPGWTFGNNIYPISPEAGGVGTASNRISSLYTKSVQITDSGIFPRTNKGANIGTTGGSFNNIYLENSPIITSDKKDKYGYVGLSEEEIKCAIACAKLYRRYQMKEAVIEKGEDQARFHIGVIAQDLIECFTQHGLDWTRYGIFIYQKVESRPAVIESWEDEWIDILEEKDDDGNIIKEASRHLRRAAGSITLEPAVEAGEYYKLRYDELNCFINAGISARLDFLMKK